jgi:hypothetical protein
MSYLPKPFLAPVLDNNLTMDKIMRRRNSVLDSITERFTDSIYRDENTNQITVKGEKKWVMTADECNQAVLTTKFTSNVNLQNNVTPIVKDENISQCKTIIDDSNEECWYSKDLNSWKKSCQSSSQLTDTVLGMIISWFISWSTSGSLINSIFKNVAVDVMNWAAGATQIIFENIKMSNIPLFLPSWIGSRPFLIPDKEKTKNYQRTATKLKFFETQFSVLKIFTICSTVGSIQNVDCLIDYLTSKIEGYFKDKIPANYGNEIQNPSIFQNSAEFFSFVSTVEFLIQLLSHLSDRVLRDGVVIDCIRRLVSVSLLMKQNINNSKRTYEKSSNGSNNRSNSYVNNYNGVKIKKGSDSVQKNHVLALVTLTGGIGYILIHRCANESSSSLLLKSEWDVGGSISALFSVDHVNRNPNRNTNQEFNGNLNHHPNKNFNDDLSHNFNDDMSQNSSKIDNQNREEIHSTNSKEIKTINMTIHPAMSIIMNTFFIPQICVHCCDQGVISDLCEEHSIGLLDPSEDFSSLVLPNILQLLPCCKSALTFIFQSPDTNINQGNKGKRYVSENGSFLPNIHTLGKIEFARLTTQLASRIKERLHGENDCYDDNGERVTINLKKKRMSYATGVDLSIFSSDILIHILSFMSFKRVSRMACVSSAFSSASKESSLWEGLYRSKYRNMKFESYLSLNEIESEVIQCGSCTVLTLKAKRIKKTETCPNSRPFLDIPSNLPSPFPSDIYPSTELSIDLPLKSPLEASLNPPLKAKRVYKRRSCPNSNDSLNPPLDFSSNLPLDLCVDLRTDSSLAPSLNPPSKAKRIYKRKSCPSSLPFNISVDLSLDPSKDSSLGPSVEPPAKAKRLYKKKSYPSSNPSSDFPLDPSIELSIKPVLQSSLFPPLGRILKLPLKPPLRLPFGFPLGCFLVPSLTHTETLEPSSDLPLNLSITPTIDSPISILDPSLGSSPDLQLELPLENSLEHSLEHPLEHPLDPPKAKRVLKKKPCRHAYLQHQWRELFQVIFNHILSFYLQSIVQSVLQLFFKFDSLIFSSTF